ncbi:uncharacterized protein [Zea mays]|jgi:hypothetical protein|nr:uncharacterized protein LOC118476177 [Zea mays]
MCPYCHCCGTTAMTLPLVKRRQGFETSPRFMAFSFTRCQRVAEQKFATITAHGRESFSQIGLTALSHVVASAPFHTASCLPLTLAIAFASADRATTSRCCIRLIGPPRATTSRRSSRPLPATGSPLTGGTERRVTDIVVARKHSCSALDVAFHALEAEARDAKMEARIRLVREQRAAPPPTLSSRSRGVLRPPNRSQGEPLRRR